MYILGFNNATGTRYLYCCLDNSVCSCTTLTTLPSHAYMSYAYLYSYYCFSGPNRPPSPCWDTTGLLLIKQFHRPRFSPTSITLKAIVSWIIYAHTLERLAIFVQVSQYTVLCNQYLVLRIKTASHFCEAKCGWRDSNPYPFRDRNLNPARLPIPPHPHIILFFWITGVVRS